MDFVEQLKSSVDIVSVIGDCVRLRRSGTQRYMGLCPFHDEKTPSFTVHVVHQFYKCFSCGAGGDVVKFVMEKEGISFYEALKSLSERYGIPMPKRSNYADEDSKLRGALMVMHELAEENFRANLKSQAGEAARAYIAKRGLAHETVEHFGLGYSDRSGRALIRLFEQREFSVSQMEASGLVGKRQDGSLYDRFRNRLMFPIHNEQGKIIAFGGRALSPEDEPKYLNSPETDIYKKSKVLYNLHRAKQGIRKDDRAILVEGYMDVIGVTAAGFHNVVASCGTALTPHQVQAVKRHTHRIAVNFDPDAAGANASERSVDILLAEGMQVRIVELDGNLDPDEYCKERGPEAYLACIDGAKGYFYWLADRARAKHDMRTSEGKVAVLNFLLPKVQTISDNLERMTVANDVAGYIGIDRGLVLDHFKKAASDRDKRPIQRPASPLRHDERMLLIALLTNAEGRSEVLEQMKMLETIESLPSRRIFHAIFALDDAGSKIGFEEVNSRLEEADQNLLAQAVLNEDGEISREEVIASVESLRRSEQQYLRLQLKAKISESERSGNFDEAVRLTMELQGIEKAARGRRS
ncbi:MAG: primase [Candidatus Solibacter sp.]|nr:primase [Candidatus Solibacter sp.]